MRAVTLFITILEAGVLCIGNKAQSSTLLTTLDIPAANVSSLPGRFTDVCKVPGRAVGSCAPGSLQAAGEWDPRHLATEEEWNMYRSKGSWLGCLLDATDEAAGKAWPDPYSRVPMSASSPWKGTLESEFSYPVPLHNESAY